MNQILDLIDLVTIIDTNKYNYLHYDYTFKTITVMHDCLLVSQ